MIFKWIFKLGQQKRNPSINKWFLFLKKTEQWSLEELENYQLKKLKEIVSFAYNHSDYYKNLFDKNSVNPNAINNLSAVKKLPILEKKDLLNFNTEIHTKAKFSKLFKASTSGSSGESLVFKREESTDSFNRASIFRGYSWYDIQPWDKNGYFWGFNFSKADRVKTNFLDALQNRFRIFSYEKEEFEDFVKKLKSAKYIHGYSSMIYQTAKLINTNNLEKPKNLKMVKGTSEKIFEKYQSEVKKAFNLKIISEYGATESGIIAFECPEGSMHLNMEGVLVEEVEKEILVTNLQLKAFPIIRYKLGDYIELAPKDFKCKCGRAHRVLKEVTGRIGDNVYGVTKIYPSLYFYYIFKNLVKQEGLKLNYQVIQNQKGFLNFKIEQTLTSKDVKILKDEIAKYFKEDINFEIQYNQTLETKSGKFKSFISNISDDK